MGYFDRTSRVAIALVLASTPTASWAQQTSVAEETADKSESGLEDIIVTAQRSEASIQKTPISMQVYGAEELTERGITDIASLARTDASININYSTGQPIIAIRGVSSQNVTEVGDPAVSIATDGIFTNRPYGTFGGIYDVERVEILRGPQGTLFGRNSTGGTVNVITARANNSNEGRITAEAGNYDLFGSDGFGNFVLSDGLYARVSYSVRTRKGFRDNSPVTLRGDAEDLKSGRFQIAFEPNDSLSGWLLAQYTQQEKTMGAMELIPFTYIGETNEPVHTMPASRSNGKRFSNLTASDGELRLWQVRGGLTYSFANGVSINYLGGYDKINYYRQNPVNPFFGGVGNGPTPVPTLFRSREKPETINQELRIASDPGARLVWQAGAYYFREDSNVSAGTLYNPGSNIERKGIEFIYPKIISSSKALYAQGSFAVTDELKLTLGGRHTWDKKSREGTFFIHPGQTGLPFIITIDQPAATKSDKSTWTAGIDYQATPDNLFYAKVSTGYKTGGFNSSVSDYAPETVTAYEIGTKNNFLDRHLQVNLSAFRMDYKDQQVTQFVTGATSSGSITVNAGRSRIWGAELNVTAQSEQLGRLTFSGNYTRARYLEFFQSAGWNSSLNLDLEGNRLPLSPTWSFSGQYERPIILGNGGTLTPRIAFKTQSTQYFGANNYEVQRQGAYGLVDLGLDYTPDSEAWTLQAYVKNVGDKTVLANANEFYTFNNYTFSYQPPRTYGVRLTVNFR